MTTCWKVPILALASFFVASGSALASPASIDSVWVSNVTQTDATLNAKINPNGLYTAYEFQIDTDARYDFTKRACPLSLPGRASCQLITVGVPLPPGLVEPEPASIPAGMFGDQKVSVAMGSIGATLKAAATYHYRVIASNGEEDGEAHPDQTFMTLPAPSSRAHVGSWNSTGSMPSTWTYNSSAVTLLGGDVLTLPGLAGDEQSVTPDLYDPRSGRWSKLPAIPARVAFTTPVALADGGALLVGGSSCSALLRRCTPNAFVARLNPSHSAWSSTTSMHEARVNPAVVRLPDGLVLVAGGFDDDCPETFAGGYSCKPLTSAEIFDPTNDAWSMTAPMPRQPGATSATLLSDGTVLVLGGGKSLRYLPRAGRWKTAGASASAGGGSNLFSLPGNRALAIGIQAGGGFFGSLGGAGSRPPPRCNPTSELFEGAIDAWTISLTEPAGDSYCPSGAALTGGQVLLTSVMNYSQSGAVLTSPYLLDAKQRCWSKTAPPLERRDGGAVVALRDGRALVFGGYDASSPNSLPSVSSAEIYTPGSANCTASPHGASKFAGVMTTRRHRLTLTASRAIRLLEECPATASVRCVGHVRLTLLVPPTHAGGKRHSTRLFLGEAPFAIPAAKPTWVTAPRPSTWCRSTTRHPRRSARVAPHRHTSTGRRRPSSAGAHRSHRGRPLGRRWDR
jgi:hypothetical protein